MLILTCPGEKVMNPKFGVGLRNYLFENFPEDEIIGQIHEQVSFFMPFLEVLDVRILRRESNVYLTVVAFIKPLSLKVVLDIEQNSNSGN